SRHLGFPARPGKRLDVDVRLAALVTRVRDPSAIRREHGRSFGERSLGERKWFPIAKQRKDPDIGSSRGVRDETSVRGPATRRHREIARPGEEQFIRARSVRQRLTHGERLSRSCGLEGDGGAVWGPYRGCLAPWIDGQP